LIDRAGNGATIGKRLLSLSNRLIRHWHKIRDGTLPWRVDSLSHREGAKSAKGGGKNETREEIEQIAELVVGPMFKVLGFLVYWNVPAIKDGMKRMVIGF